MSPSYPHYPLRVIGLLKSDFGEKFCAPRQPGLVPSSRASLTVRREYQPQLSLKGLDGFSHVWLLTYFHLNTNKGFKSSAHPPRLGGKTVGVFASRSPHRPSALGLTLARLDTVAGDTLHLSGVDLVDGTPVLDVKPYIPSYDRAPRAKSGWAGRAPERRLAVSFVPKALKAARAAGAERLIKEVLAQDPRNPRDGFQNAPDRVHAARLRGLLVRFTAAGGAARVVAVGPDREGAAKVAPPRRLFAA